MLSQFTLPCLEPSESSAVLGAQEDLLKTYRCTVEENVPQLRQRNAVQRFSLVGKIGT